MIGDPIEPWPVERMGKEEIDSTEDLICGVLRSIYHATNDEAIKLKCRIATTMARKMSDKLKGYKQMIAFGPHG
jgi:hypothetical protein